MLVVLDVANGFGKQTGNRREIVQQVKIRYLREHKTRPGFFNRAD